MRHSRSVVALTLLVALAAAGMTRLAHAQADLRIVDGTLWAASSVAEKRAYLIGVANTVAVNRAAQVQLGKADPQSANDRIDTALDGGTIDTAISRIDSWYAANPSQRNVAVLGVVWMAMVDNR